MKLTAIMWAALAVVVGISLFMLKYQVQGLEDQLHATYAQIEKDKTAIRVLEAEWTYLNDPGRLRRLSEQYLGFTPPVASQVLTVSQLPFKNGEAPAFEGVSNPPAKPVDAPLTGVREARDAAPDVALQPVTFAADNAALNAKDALTARLMQLQRLLPATWTIQPANAAISQEPLR